MNDLRQRLIELRDQDEITKGGSAGLLLGRPDRDTLTEAIEELDRIERVREWARGYPQTENPDWGEYIKAQKDVEALLGPAAPPEDSP